MPMPQKQAAKVNRLARYLVGGLDEEDNVLPEHADAREALIELVDAAHQVFGAGPTGRDIIARWPDPNQPPAMFERTQREQDGRLL